MPTCPYCKTVSELVTGDVVYPHRPDLKTKFYYYCAPCQAYVGCHPGTTASLGRLANAELRALKSKVHSLFDPLWKTGRMTRKGAYYLLAKELGLTVKKCHIGCFDESTCEKAITFLTQDWSPSRRPGHGNRAVPQGGTDERQN